MASAGEGAQTTSEDAQPRGEYSVSITRAGDEPARAPGGDAKLARVEEILEVYGVAVSFNADSYTIRVNVEGHEAVNAVRDAHQLINQAVDAAELPDWPVVEINAIEVKEL